MQWRDIEFNQNTNEINVPDNWLYLHYYEALNVLFRFENSLRVFVYVILKEQLKDKWDETNIRSNDSIRTVSKQRKSQANEYGYLSYEIESPMLYLSSNELVEIIMNEKNWPYFKEYFKAKKEIIKHKLLEIGAVRNSLAHFRPIHTEDLDVIKQNAKHTLINVEDCLNKITTIYNLIPTNNKEDWYLSFKKLKSKNFNTFVYKSKKSKWIRLEFEFIPYSEKNLYETDIYKGFTITNLSILNVLKKYNTIKNNIIYASNSTNKMYDGNELKISKKINFVLSIETISKIYLDFIKEVEEVFKKVDLEIELLKKDTLAEGELLNNVYISTNYTDNNWVVYTDSLNEYITDYEGSEYWGERSFYMTDFISSSYQYPWMPVNISKGNFLF